MKQCPRCGETKPAEDFGRQHYCRPCHSAAVIESQRKHRQRFNAYQTEYRNCPENAEKMAAKRAHDYEVWKRKTAYDRVVKRDSRLNAAEMAAKRKVQSWARVRRFAEAHPERYAEQRRRLVMSRYARKKGAQGTATTEQIRQRWAYYGDRCWMCGDPATQTDHVIPLNRGGSDWPANQRPACGPCNRSKSDRLLAELAS